MQKPSAGTQVSQPHCFGQCLLSPFQGVMQVISIEHGEAESMDGFNWALYVNHEDIVSHTGMFEVRYGSWNRQNGIKLSMVRGTVTNSVIDSVGQQLAAAVQKNAVQSPFPLHDRYECWMLSEDGLPLALIDSVTREDRITLNESPFWHPCAAAFKEFQSEHGDAEQLKHQVNQRAGRRPKSLWVKREKYRHAFRGDAHTDSGEMIKAELFPDRLLLEQWPERNNENLVKDYLAWQAPWLLLLDSYDDEMRRAIEVLDEQQLKVVRVLARLMGYDNHNGDVIEAFIHTQD